MLKYDSLLREKAVRLPILKDTPAEKARYKRKVEETQKIIANAHKKFDFRTVDGSTSHYFLTGARFNRFFMKLLYCVIKIKILKIYLNFKE